MHITREFIAGTAENVEAEYGFAAPYNGAFVLVQLDEEGEAVAIEDFTTVAGLARSLAEVEDRTLIEWLL